MPQPASPTSPERRSAQVIYPAAFGHAPAVDQRPSAAIWALKIDPCAPSLPAQASLLKPNDRWAVEAVYEHLVQRAIALPDEPVEASFDPATGTFTVFGAGLLFAEPSIVQPLPIPPRGLMARLFGGGR